ncbi:tRNA (guanosine(37)-N1)-methyltransferase TrmD [Kineococcus glutinatus]|uniref:tRNA (guanine-N(1)-)-methyltransferase n=1 Tax=Kineococcus glutinatus TaxID=1070872 RepID=A0ABP9HA11_9ACTN
MRVDVVTIFPGYLQPLSLSLLGRARADGLLDLRVHDLREHTHDRHRTVDDTPYGGGAGMLMRPEPWGEALDAVLADPPPGAHPQGPVLLVPSPAGEVFRQAGAVELAAEPWLVFACGRYEGIDARVVQHYADRVRVREVSLGDYVLNGGEVAVLVVVEAVARLLPGVVGNAASIEEESHAAAHDGLLEAPAYTKPPTWRGLDVPAVLSSGHHGLVARWRRDEALRRTARRRPDIVAGLDVAACDGADLRVLAEEGWAPDGSGRFGPAARAVAD